MTQQGSSTWTPDRSEAVKALIRETIQSAGDIAPDQLPHHIRQRLRDQVAGTANLDKIIADIIAEERAKQ